MRGIARALAVATGAWVVAAATGACSRPGAHPPPAPKAAAGPDAIVIRDPREAEAEAQVLQQIYGYTAGPLTVGDDWRRRTYSRNGATIEVTIAGRALRPYEYEAWYQQSRHYPTARLPFPADQSSGFFTCAGDGGAPPCDLHGQTREGIHIEMRGSKEASRADLENLLELLTWK
jgi:hypothetical protein